MGVHKYDQLNRPVLTGKSVIAGVRATVQMMVNDFYDIPSNKYYEDRGTEVHDYTNQSFPYMEGESSCLSVIYYDDYNFTFAGQNAFVPEGDLVAGSTEFLLRSGKLSKGKRSYNRR